MSRDQYEADKRRLWQHIFVNAYGTSDLSTLKHAPPDPEGYAFFLAIDSAYTECDKMRGNVPVDRQLVQYLAGWARDTARGYDQRPGTDNHFVNRALEGFISTLRDAIKRGQLRDYGDGRLLYGCFTVPQWLVDKYMDEAHEEASHLNKLWDEDSYLQDFIRHASA
jgi:hypothetical protein